MSDTSREKNIYRNAWSHWQSWMASRLVLVKASCPVILSQRGWYVLLEVSIFLAMDVACILIVKSARTFEPLLLPPPLYDKSARSPYVERMRPLS